MNEKNNKRNNNIFYACSYNLEYRFCRRKLYTFLHRKKKSNNKKDFHKILYVTAQNPPIDFVDAIRKQYPNKKIQIVIPIEKPYKRNCLKYSFKCFIQNRTCKIEIYEKEIKENNIKILGLYCENCIDINPNRIETLAPFIVGIRKLALKLKPDIVQIDNIPFFLGCDLDKNKKKFPFKIFQTISDPKDFEYNKIEPFWYVINFAKPEVLNKICKDKFIRENILQLFNINHNNKYKILDYISIIIEKFEIFKQIYNNDNQEDKIIFDNLNKRILELFPILKQNSDTNYNIMNYSISRSDFWAIESEKSYNKIFQNTDLTQLMYEELYKHKDKSSFVQYGYKFNESEIQYPFDVNNFKENKILNKKYIIKEFSRDRIKTQFYDTKLFNNNTYTIRGFLDSIDNVPLIFCNFTDTLWTSGADIALNCIIQLLNKYKNIKFIINIKNGLQNEQIQKWLSFLENNTNYSGEWLFIDGDIDLEQFYASADITFIPHRKNIKTYNHYIAMRYGCIPITSKTGVLDETINDIFDNIAYGCGFKIKNTEIDSEQYLIDFYQTALKALNIYAEKPTAWRLLIKNAMSYDSSWNVKILEQYNKIYEKLL